MKFVKKYQYEIIIFFIAFLPRVIPILYAQPIRTPSDEMGTLAVAASMAGLDWTAVTSKAGYYGFGSTILFSFLLRIISNPYLLYRLLLIGQVLLQSLGGLICFHILKVYFSEIPLKMKFLISILSNYVVVTRAMVIYNEHMLILLSWIFAWLLLFLSNNAENKKKRAWGSILLLFFLVYGLTIHIRFKIVWIAIAIFVLIQYFIKKQWIVELKIIFPLSIIGYFIMSYILKNVQNTFWISDSGSSLRNTEIPLQGAKNLLKPISWQAWSNIVVGEINTGNIIFGGLMIMGIILFIIILFQVITKKKILGIETVSLNNQILILFFGLCILGTIAGQSITWLNGATDVLLNGFNNSSYNYNVKAFTYVRYYGPYCGPFLTGILIYLNHKYQDIKTFWKYTFITTILVQLYWVICIFPYIYNTKIMIILEALYPFSFTNSYEETAWYIGVLALLNLGVILACFYFFQKKGKLMFPMILLTCSLIYQYQYNAYTYDFPMQKEQVEKVEETYNFIENLENKVDMPDSFYVYDASALKDHQMFFTYQFYFNRIKIIPNLPEKSLKEAIVFTNYADEECEELLKQGYLYTVIADNQVMYVKGKRLQQQFMDVNVSLQHTQLLYSIE